jgi:hypothetical protein
MATRKTDDAIALLKSDHRKVEDLFAKAQKTRDGARKQALVTQICTELTIHARVEEEIFYPATTGQAKGDIINEAYVEHDGAKVLISELLNSDPSNEFYDAKIKVLSEDIKHHVKEEEKPRSGIFAQARAAGLDLQGLGERIMARKQELLTQFEGRNLPPPETRSFTGHKMRQGKPVDGGTQATK